MIRVVCSLIAVVLTTCQASGNVRLISPCPKVFKYEIQVENRQPLAKRWYGVVNLATNVTYHALWLNIILDRKADILGSWIGEVTTKDNVDFMIENLNITINPDQKRTACFFVQYSSDFQPKVKSIFVNGREVCYAYDTGTKVDKSNPRSNNNGGNSKNRIKSPEKTVAGPIVKIVNKKTHHFKKIIRTTTYKPSYHKQTTIRRTQTSTRGIKNIQPVYETPRRKTQLFFLKKSKNNQHTSVVTVGNSTCISCKLNVNNESIYINNTEKRPTVPIQQDDYKDKNLHINIETFNNLHTGKNSSLTTDHLAIKIRGDNRSISDNNRDSGSLNISKNAFVTSTASTTRKVTDDSETFEILETAETTFITTQISPKTQIKGDNSPTTDSNRRFDNFHATDNVNLTTKLLTTMKMNGDVRLKIDNHQRFDYLHALGNETLMKQIGTAAKLRDDNRPKPNNNQRFNTFYTTENVNLTNQISTTTKTKNDDKSKTEHNEGFDYLQTGQNKFTTEISTTRKIKDSHILKIAHNHRFHSLQTTPIPFTTISIATTRRNEGNNRANTENNRGFDNLQKTPNLHKITVTKTTTDINVEDRLKIDNNHRFDSLEKSPNRYLTTTFTTTRNIKGDDRRNLQSATIGYVDILKTKGGGGSNPDDFEVENNEDGLDTLGVIGLPETSGRPPIDTTFDNIPSSHLQSDIRDIFRLPIRDEEEEIHIHGDRAVIHPNFDPEPTCGKVLKPQPLHLPYGSSTSEGQWPWQVAIYQQRTVDLKYICGGTLVSRRHVITAAHCVTRKRTMGLVHMKTLTVYLGKFNLRLSVEGVQVRFVKGIRVHPEYNSTTFSRDLALLELRSPADITDLVRPVCLWPEDEIDLNNVVGKTGSVVGWSFEDSSLTNAELHLTEMPVFEHETCINAFDNFYNTLLSEYTYCAGYKQGTDTCNSNDSGGGMVFKKGNSWYFRGIVSVSISLENEHRCDSKHFIVFTDIAKFLAWIRDYTD